MGNGIVRLQERGALRIVLIGIGCCALSISVVKGADKQWVTTHKWTGQGTRQTGVFTVKGDKWRIAYDPQGKAPFHINVYTRDREHEAEAAIQRILVKGKKTLYTGKGKKFLRVQAPEARWRISVQQYLSIIGEWQLRKEGKEGSNEKMTRVATWTGEDVSSRSYRIVFGSRPWHVSCRNQGKGKLNITVDPVSDAKGEENTHADASTSRQSLPSPVMDLTIGPGERQTGWGYKAGRYKLTVEAEDTTWKIQALEQMSSKDQKQGKEELTDPSEDSSLQEPRVVPRRIRDDEE